MFRRAASTIVTVTLVGISLLALTQWAGASSSNPKISVSITDNQPGAFPDRTDVFDVPSNYPPGDANFSLVVTFIPPAFCQASLASDCSTVDGSNLPTGPAVPLGTHTGKVDSVTRLALSTASGSINDTCSDVFPVHFDFYNAVTSSPGPILNVIGGKVDVDNSGTITGADDGVVSGRQVIDGMFDVDGPLLAYPNIGGQGNGTSGQASDDGIVEYKKLVTDGLLDGSVTTIDSGIVSGDPIAVPADPLVIQAQTPHGVGTLPNGVALYPNYLVTSLEPAGVLGTQIVPRLRVWGTTVVSGTTVILMSAVFNTGALVGLGGLPYTTMTAAKGWPSETFLQDPAPYAAGLGQISDFCTPLLSTTVSYGISHADGVGGVTATAKMSRNPLALTVTTCGTLNAGCGGAAGSEASSSGGAGNTGTHLERQLVRTLRDADNDGIENEMDTCPYTANISGDPRTTNGGVDGNGLDEACDPHTLTGVNPTIYDVDGDGWANRIDNCPLIANGGPDPLGGPTRNAAFDILGNPIDPNTPAQQDTDQPVYVKPADGGPPTDGIGDACDLAPTVPNGHIHTVENKVGICVGGPAGNNDNDKNTALAAAPDGWCDARETFMGTTTTDNCGGSPLDPNAWPPDLSGDRYVTSTDKTKMSLQIKAYTANHATGYLKRYDMNADGAITSTDKTILVLLFASGVPNPPAAITGPQGCVP